MGIGVYRGQESLPFGFFPRLEKRFVSCRKQIGFALVTQQLKISAHLCSGCQMFLETGLRLAGKEIERKGPK